MEIENPACSEGLNLSDLLDDDDLLDLRELLGIDSSSISPQSTLKHFTMLQDQHLKAQAPQPACLTEDHQQLGLLQPQHTPQLPTEPVSLSLGAFDDLSTATWSSSVSYGVYGDQDEPATACLPLCHQQQQVQRLAVLSDSHAVATSAPECNTQQAICGEVAVVNSPQAGLGTDGQLPDVYSALTQLRAADSAAAVFSITSKYLDSTRRRSSIPLSPTSGHSKVSMCLSALLNVLEDSTQANQKQQDDVAVAAASSGVQGSNRNLLCGQPAGAGDAVSKESELLGAALCNVLTAAAASAISVTAVKCTSPKMDRPAVTEPKIKRMKLLAATGSNTATAAAAGSGCWPSGLGFHTAAAMPPLPCRPHVQQQQQQQSSILAAAAALIYSPVNTPPKQSAVANVVTDSLNCATTQLHSFTSGFSKNAVCCNTELCTTATARGTLSDSLLLSIDSSLADSLLQLQALCAAHSSKKLSANMRLYQRQLRRCDVCERAVHEAVVESQKLFAAGKFNWLQRGKPTLAA